MDKQGKFEIVLLEGKDERETRIIKTVYKILLTY